MIMVNRSGRDDLAEKLRALIEGHITTDEFSHARPDPMDDRALPAVWAFGYSLYSDVTPYRLTGRYAASSHIRESARRCALFLQSGLEYDWPSYPEDRISYFLIAWLLLVISVFANFAHFGIGLVLYAIGVFQLIFYYVHRRLVTKKKVTAFWASGDQEVWPFFRRTDYEHALMNCEPEMGI